MMITNEKSPKIYVIYDNFGVELKDFLSKNNNSGIEIIHEEDFEGLLKKPIAPLQESVRKFYKNKDCGIECVDRWMEVPKFDPEDNKE